MMIQNNIMPLNFFCIFSMGVAFFVDNGHGFSYNNNTSQQPNVVLILTDDQGSVDVNCYGAKDLSTPNMDRLAKQGVRFTQFYVGAPVCSPSRAALLTGRYPQRAQLATNAYGSRGLPSTQITLAEIFKKSGYRTGIFGKWHLGDVSSLSPNAQGFDEFLGHKVGCIDNYSHYFYWQGPNRHDLWKNDEEHFEPGTYFPDIIVREAKRFIEKNKNRSFFLYAPFNTPHYPMQAEQKFVEMYEHINDPKRKRYAAFVSTLDEKIGQVIAKLDELNLRENTIIIFLSDHGHSVEERAFGGGGSAGPYRGHKFTLWEGGIRVPCIISWPGHIAQDATRDQLCCSMDWFPTLAEYCNIELPKRKIDGKSITSLIASETEKSPHPVMHWAVKNRWAVREENWKLVSDNEELFLSDMSIDVTETKNIAPDHPDVVKRLQALHEEWLVEVENQ